MLMLFHTGLQRFLTRALYALLASVTLFVVAPGATRAQSGGTIEPSTTPQVIGGEPAPGTTNEAADSHGDVIVAAGETRDNLVVRGRRLVLEGHVSHDVLAIDCDVVVKPGAKVGNLLNMVGGSLDNQAGDSIRVVHQDSGLADMLPSSTGASLIAIPTPVPTLTPAAPAKKGSWGGGQVALWIFGMLGGLILHLVAPGGSRRISELVREDQGRSLGLGLIAAATMGAMLFVGSWLMHTPFQLLLAPFVAAVAIICIVMLGSGWLCGMAAVGRWIQMRLGRAEGNWHTQAMVGLTGCLLLNCLLGAIHPYVGIGGMALETLAAIAGLGAAIRSGFGSDPAWLTTRMRGGGRWFTGTPRL